MAAARLWFSPRDDNGMKLLPMSHRHWFTRRLSLPMSWLLIKPYDISDEEAIDVRIIDQKELAKAEQPPIAASPPPQPLADTGVGHDAIHLPDANLGKPEPLIQGLRRMENGWYRSEKMLSEAEISNPKHERLRAAARPIGVEHAHGPNLQPRSDPADHKEWARVSSRGCRSLRDGGCGQQKAIPWSRTALRSRAKVNGTIFRFAAGSRLAPGKFRGSSLLLGQRFPEETGTAHSLPNRPVGLAED